MSNGTNRYFVTVSPKRGGVPAGGITGQVLTKNSGADWDSSWSNLGSNILASGTPVAGQLAIWVDAAHIQGSNILTLGGGDAVQQATNAAGHFSDLRDGTVTNPVTTAGATTRISRTEFFSAPVGSGSLDQEASSALQVSVRNKTGSQQQVVGIEGFADNISSGTIGTGPGDCAAAYFTGYKSAGANGAAVGVFSNGARSLSTQVAIGAEVHVSNVTATDGVYNAGGLVNGSTAGLWITGSGDGAHHTSNTLGIGLYGFADGLGGQIPFKKGVSFTTASILESSIIDESSSTTSYQINGSHGNGLDTNQATFSGSAIRLGNTHPISSRNAANSADLPLVSLDATNALNLFNGAAKVTTGLLNVTNAAASSTTTGATNTSSTSGSYAGLFLTDDLSSFTINHYGSNTSNLIAASGGGTVISGSDAPGIGIFSQNASGPVYINGKNNTTLGNGIVIGNGLSVGTPVDSGLGIVNTLTGYRVNNTATTGNVLRGNGTNFVGAQLSMSDLGGSITLSGDATGSGTTAITVTNVNLPDGVTQAGKLVATNIVAPATPAAGKNNFYFDSTSKNIASKNDAGTVNHGIQTRTATASNWIRSIADDGSTTISQPVPGDVGLGNVTNDAQTKAAIVPNTAPSAGQILAGNAGGTAYAPVSVSGSGATFSLASTGVLTVSGIANASLTNSSITIGGTSTALGGTVLGNVTNDAQTKAAIVPNTVPSAGQILAGNAGGTAYAPVSVSGSGATVSLSSAGVLALSAIANSALSNSAITISGNAVSLGGSDTPPLITLNDYGNFTIPDTGNGTQPNRLTFSGTERGTFAGSGRATVYDLANSRLSINKSSINPSSFTLRDQEYLQQLNRLALAGNETATLGGSSEIILLSPIAAANNQVDVQIFTATGAGTWTKPTSFSPQQVRVICIGGGGGGGGGASNTGAVVRCGGAGGGGGAYCEKIFRASDLGTTEALNVGSGGTSGAAGASGGSGGNGGDGTASTFGTILKLNAGAGAGGAGGANSAAVGGGGGGGGITLNGTTGSTAAGAGGGSFVFATGQLTDGGAGASGGVGTQQPISGLYGGAGGGGHTAVPANDIGGNANANFGASGGGVGGGANVTPALVNATAGGGPFGGVGGGVAGTSGAAPTAGSAGANSTNAIAAGGGGGGGGTITASTNGGNGGNGGTGGGGGGGGGVGSNTGTGGAGGVGGRGEIRIYSW